MHKPFNVSLLNEKNVDFIEYNINKDPIKREEMLKKSNGARTVPQIFIEDYHVGGNRELQTLNREGKEIMSNPDYKIPEIKNGHPHDL